MPGKILRALTAALLCLLLPGLAAAAPMFGINESGLEFGSGVRPGKLNKDYVQPNPAYYLGLGVKIVRIPYLLNRMQTAPGTPLDPAYLGNVLAIAKAVVAAGAVAVVDPHNFGDVGTDGVNRDIATDPIGTANYEDAITRMAQALANQPGMALELMNEPNEQPDAAYVALWDKVIPLIRNAGFTGTIVVPHGAWDSALSVQATSQLSVTDPLNKWVLDVHSYLDPNNSGTYTQPIASAAVGVDRLAGVIAWSKATGVQVLLGETGAPSDAASVAALANELAAVSANPQVFWGVTLWGAGPWWPAAYSMHLDPINGAMRPQTAALVAAMAGGDSLALYMAEDAYGGDAEISVAIDGSTVLPDVVITAGRSGMPQAVPVPGVLGAGVHTVKVSLLHDNYGGGPAADRNAFVVEALINVVRASTADYQAIYSGSRSFEVTEP